jgi:hypothetical protein
MVVLGEKLGGGPADRPAGVLGIVLGAIFLRSSRVHPTLLMASKRLPHMWTAHKKHTCSVRGLAWEACVMCIRFFPVGCTSI